TDAQGTGGRSAGTISRSAERMPSDVVALLPSDAHLAPGETPSVGCARCDVVVAAPEPRHPALMVLVPCVDGRGHSGVVVVVELYQHVGVVVARRNERAAWRRPSCFEELAYRGLAAQQRCDSRTVVKDSVVGEQVEHRLVELVIDDVGV